MPDTDRVASALAGIRAEAHVDINVRPHSCPIGETACSAHNAIRAVAAVEAVLALADEFDVEDGYNAEAEPDLGRPGSRGDKIRRNVTQALLRKEGIRE